jgi:hypothetical protein
MCDDDGAGSIFSCCCKTLLIILVRRVKVDCIFHLSKPIAGPFLPAENLILFFGA